MCTVYSFEYQAWMDDMPPFSQKVDDFEIAKWFHDASTPPDGIEDPAYEASPTIRPSGINLRNLAPIIRRTDLGIVSERAWWGYLAKGEPVRWPSLNTRSERLQERPGGANRRVLVPATGWFEMQKPSRDWYQFSPGRPFVMAGVMQRGTPRGGTELTCYSLVMRNAVPELKHIHDRMPLVLPSAMFDRWLDPETEGSRELIDEALAASQELLPDVRAEKIARSPLSS